MCFKKTAVRYFLTLLEKEKHKKNTNLRLSVEFPYTEDASINLIYCYEGEEISTDVVVATRFFSLFIEKYSLCALDESTITYNITTNKLVIKAPHMKGQNTHRHTVLKNNIKNVLTNEVNPTLQKHGGFVTLIALTNNKTLLLEFGGNCSGCGLLSVTLEKTVKKILKKRFPFIKKIIEYKKNIVNPYLI